MKSKSRFSEAPRNHLITFQSDCLIQRREKAVRSPQLSTPSQATKNAASTNTCSGPSAAPTIASNVRCAISAQPF